MGKIKKIKAERKRAEVERQIKKTQQVKLFTKTALIGFLVLAVMAGGFYGYKVADARYGVGNKIASATNKIKETLRPARSGSETQKEEKVENPSTKAQDKKTYNSAPAMQIDEKKQYIAKFETSKGVFEIELLAAKAPKTVNNFVFLAREKFYDGLIFHRVIKDFMIQGGDPQGTGTGGPGYKFEDEFNDVKLVKGVLAMANSGANTNGSQFFVVTAEKTEWLDGKHTAFGRVSNGLDVVMQIQNAEVDEGDKPKEAVVINKLTITEK